MRSNVSPYFEHRKYGVLLKIKCNAEPRVSQKLTLSPHYISPTGNCSVTRCFVRNLDFDEWIID